MQNAALMCVMDGTGRAGQQFHRASGCQWSADDELLEAGPLNQFHREIMLTLDLANLVNRDNLWMIQISSRFRFGLEALEVGFGSPRAQDKHL